MSLLDAAYEVLKKSGNPMSPADIVRLVLESRMWTTKGKTPEQILHKKKSKTQISIRRDIQLQRIIRETQSTNHN